MIFSRMFGRSKKPGWKNREDQNKAAELLVTPTALADLSASDARVVVGYMLPKRIESDTVFIREGEATQTDFMVLVLDGEVLVQNEVAFAGDSTVMSIVGPGSIVGEMAVIDGVPRSATCTASTDLTVVILTRDELLKIINDNAPVAARLLLAISKRLTDRLRQANQKIKILGGVSRALQQELEVAHEMLHSA